MSDSVPQPSTAHYAVYVALISAVGSIIVALISQWKNIFPPETIVELKPKPVLVGEYNPSERGATIGRSIEPIKPASAIHPIAPQVLPRSAPDRAAVNPTVAEATTEPVAFAGGILVIDAHEDSWVDLRPRGSRALVSALLKAGTIYTVQIKEPVTLVVGNPEGVKVTLDERELLLPPIEGKTISRIQVK